jgi:hypothetical protein
MAAAPRRSRPATVSWPTVQAAVAEHAAVVFGEPGPTAVIGIDETRFGSPKRARNGEGRWRLTDPWETASRPWPAGRGCSGGHRADQRRGHRVAERPRCTAKELHARVHQRRARGQRHRTAAQGRYRPGP